MAQRAKEYNEAKKAKEQDEAKKPKDKELQSQPKPTRQMPELCKKDFQLVVAGKLADIKTLVEKTLHGNPNAEIKIHSDFTDFYNYKNSFLHYVIWRGSTLGTIKKQHDILEYLIKEKGGDLFANCGGRTIGATINFIMYKDSLEDKPKYLNGSFKILMEDLKSIIDDAEYNKFHELVNLRLKIPKELEEAVSYENIQDAAKALQIITNAVEEEEFNINATDSFGYSLFHRALLGGHREVIEYLLKCGANTDIIPPYIHSLRDIINPGISQDDMTAIVSMIGLDAPAPDAPGE